MNFIKTGFTYLLILCVVSACSLTGVKEVNEPEESAVSNDALLDSDEPIVKIARPAPTKSVDIPKAARNEFELAKQGMRDKDWKKAEGQLLLMSETYPQLAGVYTNLGIVYHNMEEIEKAENAYKFAIETNAYNFDAYTNLGVLYREQGRFNEAEQIYLSALALWPHHKFSVLNLGVLYDMYLGRLEEALKHYKLAQKLNDEEDRKLKGWIIDLQRRLNESSPE